MALEDFERDLATAQAESRKRKRDRSRNLEDDKSKRRHKHHHRHHNSSHDDFRERDEHKSRHRHHRHRHHEDREDDNTGRPNPSPRSPVSVTNEKPVPENNQQSTGQASDKATEANVAPQRDSWMEAPSSLSIEYIQGKKPPEPKSAFVRSSEGIIGSGEDSFMRNLHEKELESHLHDVPVEENALLDNLPASHEVDYEFGDAGSSWRMTRLRATYKQASDTERPLEEVAKERYGDLRAFDDAREEERELDRRDRFGKGYVGRQKPNGELFRERKVQSGMRSADSNIHRPSSSASDASEDEFEQAQARVLQEKPPPKETLALDQTALNKLKAQLMRAKLSNAPNAAKLQVEYDEGMATATRGRNSDVVVLDTMESRSLAGGRQSEVKAFDNTKRGRKRGHVEENEDMSIEDMVRQERRTKFSNESKRFAERIAKDGKFDDDLDYMDENASRLAKSVQKSDINLRSTAVGEYQKMKHILDTCALCSHEDTGTPPQAPIVSLATRTYLTLPTTPEITPYGCCASIVPIQHRINLLECDDDEWEEIRNFMKSLTRFYYALKPARHVVFYENAAHEGRKRHASLEAIPLPMKYAETASQFFKEAILASDEEWTQHKKIIDTQRKADEGAGKMAFRKSMVSELPYFHVWFKLDGGYGHVVEDARRWPKGDLFAREIIGGMLDVPPDVIKRQGRWKKGDPEMENRVQNFRQRWEKWDWTKTLLEAQ